MLPTNGRNTRRIGVEHGKNWTALVDFATRLATFKHIARSDLAWINPSATVNAWREGYRVNIFNTIQAVRGHDPKGVKGY